MIDSISIGERVHVKDQGFAVVKGIDYGVYPIRVELENQKRYMIFTKDGKLLESHNYQSIFKLNTI